MHSHPIQPEKRLAAACGLFCPACTLFIGTNEDPARVERLARRYQAPADSLLCDGCRSDRRGPYCQRCKMIVCTREKGIAFCHECGEYPCPELKEFQAAMPHRINLWDDQARLKEVGFDAWYMEKLDYYACPECGVINSIYDLACRRCGHEPGNEYVKTHREAIARYLKDNPWIDPA